MKELCAWITCLCVAFSGSCYIYKIWRRKTEPTTSTWIIFLAGSGLSFVTYLFAEKQDWKSGILNTADLVYIVAVLSAILWWTPQEVLLEPFEKWYLRGAGLI